jgi:hypothetical protein
MWLLQGELLVEFPDSAPVPPGSRRVDVPAGFLDEPRAFRVREGRVVRRPRKEVDALQRDREAARLSRDDVARLKRALEEGRL